MRGCLRTLDYILGKNAPKDKGILSTLHVSELFQENCLPHKLTAQLGDLIELGVVDRGLVATLPRELAARRHGLLGAAGR